MCPVILPLLHFLSTLGLWHLVQDEHTEQSINPLTRSLVLLLHVHSAIFHHSNQVRSQPLCVSSLVLTLHSHLWLLFPSVAPPSPATLTPLLTLKHTKPAPIPGPPHQLASLAETLESQVGPSQSTPGRSLLKILF